MSPSRPTVTLLALAVLLTASGLLVASNMGVMVRASFSTPGVDHWLSLPFRTALADAQDVCDALGPNATLVAYYDTATETRVEWSCPGGTNFSLQPGVGLMVQVSAATTATFLGAHDPSLSVPAGGFVHAGRDYYIALPYHSTAVVAQDLCAEIASAVLVSRFDPASGLSQDWTCPFGSNFTVQKGEALRIVVGVPADGFIPQVY